MLEINAESNSKMFCDKDGVWTFSDGHKTIKIKNDGFHFIDQYGNETLFEGSKLTFKNNSHTYEQLYNHWLKTKRMRIIMTIVHESPECYNDL